MAAEALEIAREYLEAVNRTYNLKEADISVLEEENLVVSNFGNGRVRLEYIPAKDYFLGIGADDEGAIKWSGRFPHCEQMLYEELKEVYRQIC